MAVQWLIGARKASRCGGRRFWSARTATGAPRDQHAPRPPVTTHSHICTNMPCRTSVSLCLQSFWNQFSNSTDLVPDPPFHCDFDRSTCGFTQSTNDDFDWTRHQGRTTSHGTGPSAGVGGSGTYPLLRRHLFQLPPWYPKPVRLVTVFNHQLKQYIFFYTPH